MAATVVSVEVHELAVPEYADFCAYEMQHVRDRGLPTGSRWIYVARTNTGLEGLGEALWREPEEVVSRYVGTSPFEHLGDDTSLPLGAAMYDLMGKLAGVPCYKLFGQRCRRWVPVAAWFVAASPARMAAAVQHYTAQGHTWMK